MNKSDFQKLTRQLTSDNPDEQAQARQILRALDEDAVNPLLNEYYAGVNEAQGIAILNVLAEIGGYEALNALRSICFFDLTTPLQFRKTAAHGLLLNSDNLSLDEYDKVLKIANKDSL